VFDYGPGKADWAAAGLPLEESGRKVVRLGDAARPDVPTCGLTERVGEVARRLGPDWNTSIVVNEERIVLGRLYKEELEGDPTSSVEEAMRPGPSTFRPHIPAEEMAGYMHEHELNTAPVTTSGGRLVGLVFLSDIDEAAPGGD
jgi:CBS domain-containing protein